MFNKSFFKFLFGFMFIIAVSFSAIIVVTNYFNDGGEVESEVIIAN